MFRKSEFSRNVLKVMTGTTLAQVLPLAVAPILTRLYTPDEFGVYFLFAALLGILSVGITGKYELAALLPKREKDAIHLVLLSGTVVTLLSLFLLILLVPFRHWIAGWLGEPRLAPWLLVLPLGTFAQGWYNTLNLWHNRNKRFGRITGGHMTVSATNAAGRVALGFGNLGSGGLILGTILARLIGVGVFLTPFIRSDRRLWRHAQSSLLRKVGNRYRDFPRQMVIGSLFNRSSFELPAILINYFFLPAIAGLYGQMQAIIRRPLQVIGKAFEEVFKQRASEELRTLGHCRKIFYKTLKRLALLGAIPFIILFFAAPPLFAWLFGPEWREAGVYAQIFTVPFFIQFIVSPLTSIFYLMEKTRLYSLFELGQLVLVIGSVLVAYTVWGTPIAAVYGLATAYGIGYLGRLIGLIRLVNLEK
jgi:O-antigen/teichoic acid export membrane protein